jgi:hypothetical protein
MKIKHISDLVIGDKILVEIPTVRTHTGVVSFINKECMFVWIDGEIDDETGLAIIPDKEGYYKIP